MFHILSMCSSFDQILYPVPLTFDASNIFDNKLKAWGFEGQDPY